MYNPPGGRWVGEKFAIMPPSGFLVSPSLLVFLVAIRPVRSVTVLIVAPSDARQAGRSSHWSTARKKIRRIKLNRSGAGTAAAKKRQNKTILITASD